MPDEIITPTSFLEPGAKPVRPKAKRRAKKKTPVIKNKKEIVSCARISHRLNLGWILGVGVGMLVIGYTIGISLGFNVGALDSGLPKSKTVPAPSAAPVISTVEIISPSSPALIDDPTVQEACIKKSLGDDRYVAIASNLSQATLDEQAQIAVCIQ